MGNEHYQAALYKGPYRKVTDDDGHVFHRGVRVAVCAKTFCLLRNGPYAGDFVFFEPRVPVDPDSTEPFDCTRTAPRHPRETKGADYRVPEKAGSARGPEGCC